MISQQQPAVPPHMSVRAGSVGNANSIPSPQHGKENGSFRQSSYGDQGYAIEVQPQPQMQMNSHHNRNPLNKPLDKFGERDWNYGLCSCCSSCGTCKQLRTHFFKRHFLIHFATIRLVSNVLPLFPPSANQATTQSFSKVQYH